LEAKLSTYEKRLDVLEQDVVELKAVVHKQFEETNMMVTADHGILVKLLQEMQDVKNQLNMIHPRLDMMDRRFVVFEANVDRRFVALETKVDQLDRRFVALETKVDQLDRRFVALETKVDRRFGEVDQRLDTIQTSVNQTLQLLTTLMEKIDK